MGQRVGTRILGHVAIRDQFARALSVLGHLYLGKEGSTFLVLVVEDALVAVRPKLLDDILGGALLLWFLVILRNG